MRVEDHGWLVAEPGDAPIAQIPTARTHSLISPMPLALVWHYTASRGGPGSAPALARSIRALPGPGEAAASWHLLIARDGSLVQSAPFTIGTWHVGKMLATFGKVSAPVNYATVGVELECAGRLQKIGADFYAWPYWTNPTAPAAERVAHKGLIMPAGRAVEVSPGVYFDSFSDAQVKSATALVAALVKMYGWSSDVCRFGHRDFDFPRKEDPGPLWPAKLAGILQTVFHGG